MKLVNLILCLSICFGLNVNAQNRIEDFEPYEQVVDYFLQHAGVHQSATYKYFRLIRKPEGYFAAVMEWDGDLEEYTIGEEYLFWSLKQKQYLKVPQSQLPESKTETSYKQQAQEFQRYAHEFKRNLFFGYPKWYEDVIEALAGEKQLDARQRYALGRAYSAKADVFLNPNREHKKDHFLERYAVEDIPDLAVEGFIDNLKLAIEQFRQLDAIDPDFPIMVGYPAIKYANEHVLGWMELRVIGRQTQAKEFLKPDIYPPAILAVARNILQSCEPNAMLFVNGDNDCFPIHYLQEYEGFRRDVTVLNLVLLNSARHLNYYMNMLSGEQALPEIEPLEYYAKPDNLIFRSPDDVFDLKPRSAPFKPLKCEKPAKDFKIGLRGFAGNRYLYRQDRVVLDIIEANKWKRPIYFSLATARIQMLNLDQTMRIHGLAGRVTPYQYEAECIHDVYRNGLIEKDILYRNIMERFDYSGFGAGADHNAKMETAGGFLQVPIYQLATALQEDGDEERFEKILQHYLKHFPVAATEANFIGAEFAGFFHQTGRTTARDAMIEKLYVFCKHLTISREKQALYPERKIRTAKYLISCMPGKLKAWGLDEARQQWEELAEDPVWN